MGDRASSFNPMWGHVQRFRSHYIIQLAIRLKDFFTRGHKATKWQSFGCFWSRNFSMFRHGLFSQLTSSYTLLHHRTECWQFCLKFGEKPEPIHLKCTDPQIMHQLTGAFLSSSDPKGSISPTVKGHGGLSLGLESPWQLIRKDSCWQLKTLHRPEDRVTECVFPRHSQKQVAPEPWKSTFPADIGI